ncbi:aspartyl/asparaginyl beta-hydroxylase [Stackebrandtia albiflava]|uniref:Aspartyl/asparaginyl beta-hydroxylase n=1 Tax=Stackebrandtia albiflava TaxID=406432 RepID=A0A562VDS5_9ACTN|nr:aspartyl/asparaginyl beta-hydroxylase domain-containing protein [Stackebrandtia albiflava]TWJ16033.1 aspartyl/asparaginyl beta-hydroxylase [Stackebrandtia albiflava]
MIDHPTDWRALPPAVRLARRYDAAELAAEVAELRRRPWRAQRAIGQDGMRRQSDIDWTILPLRSPGGDPLRTDAGGAGLVEHAETPHLDGAPALRRLIREFPAGLLAVRLMALGPGVEVAEHRDAKCGMPWGVVRLHVPVVTNPGATVVIDGRSFHWEAGRLWFGDFDRPHLVANTGTTARVHLVLDCLVGKELLDLFPSGYLGGIAVEDVVLARAPVPLTPGERDALRCRFPLPRRFLEWSEEEPVAPADATVPAEIVVTPDGPVLVVEGTPRFGLVHLGGGDLRLAGWTEERVLTVDPGRDGMRVRTTTRCGRDAAVTKCAAEPVTGGP